MIIQEGNKVLRQIAQEVPLEDIQSGEIKNLIKKMTVSLFEQENGAALAAPQIEVSKRIFIVKRYLIDNTKGTEEENVNKKEIVVFINPQITKISRKKKEMDEGCLSVEGTYGKVHRSEKLTVEAYDKTGKKFTRGCSGLLAQIVQHEVDHLDGVLFIDKASRLE